MTVTIELLCAAIVVLFVVARAHSAEDRRDFFSAFAWLSLAAAVGEASCIWLYDFYAYDPRWTVFVGPVPLMVILIWPCVVISAWDISRHVTPNRPWLLATLLVLADASLIEPIAVSAGLWSWNHPGLFAVPPVGLIGWALFAGAGVLVLERWRNPWRRALIVPLTLAVVHAGVLAIWWGGLRWFNQPVPELVAIPLLWIVSLALAVRSFFLGARERMPRWIMWVRVVPALFFLALLVVYARELPLWLWALAFVPPYVSLTRVR